MSTRGRRQILLVSKTDSSKYATVYAIPEYRDATSTVPFRYIISSRALLEAQFRAKLIAGEHFAGVFIKRENDSGWIYYKEDVIPHVNG